MKRMFLFAGGIVLLISVILIGQRTVIVKSGSVYAKLNSYGALELYEKNQSTCEGSTQVLYQDDNYKYQFECAKSSKYLIFNGSSYYTIEKGLEAEKFTISQLYYLLQGELERVEIED